MAIAATLAMLLLLAGCGLISPSRNDFVGTWVSRMGHHQAVLVLKEDGDFTLDNVPEAVFDAKATKSTVDWTQVQDLTGTWGLNKDGSLRFTIDANERFVGYDTSLSRTGLGAGLELTHRVGPIDNDVSFVFVRTK